MIEPAGTVATAPATLLRAAALACGAAGVLLALAAPNLAAWHEHIVVKTGVLTMFDDNVTASRTFATLFWTYTMLGIAAVACALTAYVRGGLGRIGRLGLVLGIAAALWKFVLYALLIGIALALFVSGLSS